MKSPVVILSCLAVLMCLLVGCSDDGNSGNTAPTGVVYGTSYKLAINAGANGVVDDTAHGMSFVFPQGGTGTLTVTPVVNAPTLPRANGKGFRLEGLDGSPIILRFPKPTDGKELTLHAYLPATGVYDGSPRPAMDWYLTPPTSSDTEYIYYELSRPNATPKRTMLPLVTTGVAGDTVEIYYPAINDPFIAAIGIREKVSQYIADIVAKLPIESQATVNVNMRRLQLVFDIGATNQNFYVFNGRTPLLSLRSDIDDNKIAHEVSHYLTHMLMTDTQYLALQAILQEDHVNGQLFTRQSGLGEDYAYVIPDMIGRGITLSPYQFFKQSTQVGAKFGGPDKFDAPSREGFAAMLLYALTLNANTIWDFAYNKDMEIPIIGYSKADVVAFIGNGAKHMEELLPQLITFVTSSGHTEKDLSVIAERTGWSYRGTGKISYNGSPVVDYRIQAVINIDGKEYSTPAVSPADGSASTTGYTLPRLFPGRQVLRVSWGSLKKEVELTVDWHRPTTENLIIPDIDLAQNPTPKGNLIAPIWVQTAKGNFIVYLQEVSRTAYYGPVYAVCRMNPDGSNPITLPIAQFDFIYQHFAVSPQGEIYLRNSTQDIGNIFGYQQANDYLVYDIDGNPIRSIEIFDDDALDQYGKKKQVELQGFTISPGGDYLLVLGNYWDRSFIDVMDPRSVVPMRNDLHLASAASGSIIKRVTRFYTEPGVYDKFECASHGIMNRARTRLYWSRFKDSRYELVVSNSIGYVSATLYQGEVHSVLLSADETKILISAPGFDGTRNLAWINTDGSNGNNPQWITQFTGGVTAVMGVGQSPDGKKLLMSMPDSSGQYRISIMNTDGSAKSWIDPY